MPALEMTIQRAQRDDKGRAATWPVTFELRLPQQPPRRVAGELQPPDGWLKACWPNQPQRPTARRLEKRCSRGSSATSFARPSPRLPATPCICSWSSRTPPCRRCSGSGLPRL